MTYIPVVELGGYVETSKSHQALEMLFNAAQNATNKRRTSTLQGDIKKRTYVRRIRGSIIFNCCCKR